MRAYVLGWWQIFSQISSCDLDVSAYVRIWWFFAFAIFASPLKLGEPSHVGNRQESAGNESMEQPEQDEALQSSMHPCSETGTNALLYEHSSFSQQGVIAFGRFFVFDRKVKLTNNRAQDVVSFVSLMSITGSSWGSLFLKESALPFPVSSAGTKSASLR